ncbi:MAG: Hsp70 family protein [Proteobacteria bacterium]|nr:Hsp70 family protein [Pseudomonadota bacterium]
MALIKISEPGASQTDERENEIVIGIDLGTTNSLAAIILNEKVRFFADENGRDIHPSIVTYGDKKISSIKRFMNVGFTEVEGMRVAPAEVSAEILKHLKNLAENTLRQTQGDKGLEIKKAVVTVPAYFDETAKNATKLAANLAGLEVLRLVNEPTAAALAYGLDNAAEGTYCVYDLGGGTFDVSILKMQKGVFKVLGVAGDNALGGDDFDDLVAEKLGVSRAEARKIKESLSTDVIASKAKQSMDCHVADAPRNDVLSNEEFEKLIAEKIGKTFSLTQNLIDDLDLEIADIKGVILVGGSTRIPLVKKKLAEIFGAEKVLDQIDPDRIVAAGAAWQAYNLSGNSENLLLDVVPLSLGIEMMGGIVDKVILRNSTIPTALTKEFTTYADNQSGMKIHIVQGERELALDCRSLAHFEIKKIPAMKAGLARVAVTFKIDADGLLTVSAEEKFTGEKQEILVKPSYGLNEDEVKKMLIDSLQNSKADIANRLLIQAITDSNHDITILKKDLEKYVGEDKKLIAEKIENLEKLIADKASRDLILEAKEEMEHAAENLILEKVNAVLDRGIVGKKVDQV